MASRKYHQNFLPSYVLDANMKNTGDNVKEDSSCSNSSSSSSGCKNNNNNNNNNNNGISSNVSNFNKIKTDSNETGSDCLPIHCIVEIISSLEDMRSVNCEKCDVDQTKGDRDNWWKCDCRNIETSGCLLVPEDTSMNDFVKTVLLKLGYPSGSSSFAAGSILIRNWKPLPLRSICPEMNKSVGDILGELTAVASLRIQIFRPKTTILEKIKDNLLSFLIKTNQNFLSDSGCPFDMCTLAKFCHQSDNIKNHFFEEFSEDIQQKFDYWLNRNGVPTKELEKDKNQLQSTSLLLNNNKVGLGSDIVGANDIVNSLAHRLDLLRSDICNKYPKGYTDEEIPNSAVEPSLFNPVDRPTRSAPAPKTRIRTSFDPEFELPKLYKWYLANPHPSRQQIFEYVAELNSLESRKRRKQLDINNVVYWFKNARAAQKRTDCRKMSNSYFSSGNKGNVLKIPSGKTSENISDDQKSVSDEEISVTSESGDDYQHGNDRCLQVVGKWNSNGQGEAVLEMQIASGKNVLEQKPEMADSKSGIESEDTKNFKDFIQEDNKADLLRQDSLSEKNDMAESDLKGKNSGRKESQEEKNLSEKTKNEISNELVPDEKRAINGEKGENEVLSPKMNQRNGFTSYKENNVINNSAFLPSYKPDFVMPPPNSVLQHSLMCVSRYMNSKPNNLSLSSEERRKRNRTFIDPVTEVPRLEQWFRLSTHPSHNLISRYTAELNNMPYRRKFPKLETKNVQFWFKNRRAKNKRLNYLENNK